MAIASIASLLVVLPILCVIVTIAALVGDRFSRHGHRIIGAFLTLVGIAALMGGVLVVIWTSGRRGPVRVRLPSVTVNRHAHGHTTVVLDLESKNAKHPSKTDKTDEGSADIAAQTAAETARPAPSSDPPANSKPAKSKPAINKKSNKSKPNQQLDKPATAATAAKDPSDNSGLPSARDLELGVRALIDFDARPEWVESEEMDIGQVHQIAVASGPRTRVREAQEELAKQLKKETDCYINKLLEDDHAAAWLDYRADEIRTRFVAPGCFFNEKVVSPSFGVMHQSHALLQFGQDFHQEIDSRWHARQAQARLAQVGLGAGTVLGVLAILFGYFRLDTATRGFYTGRLRFVTVLAILGLVAASVYLAQSIPWLRL